MNLKGLFNWFKRKISGSSSDPIDNSPLKKLQENEVVANISMVLHDEWSGLVGMIRINPSFDYWVSFITALCYVESSYNPKLVYPEPAPLHYDSIGLLQLSEVDFKNYGYPRCDLKDPYLNLKFGVFILNKMAAKNGVVIFDGVSQYWSTLRPGKNPKAHEKFIAKLNQIKDAV